FTFSRTTYVPGSAKVIVRLTLTSGCGFARIVASSLVVPTVQLYWVILPVAGGISILATRFTGWFTLITARAPPLAVTFINGCRPCRSAASGAGMTWPLLIV